MEGQALTVENIEADYRLGSDGSQLSLGEFGLEEWEVEEYLSARSRKLELAGQMMETVTGDGYGNFHVLIGIDDSSEEDSIQKNEIAYLRSLLRQGDALLSGVDDLAFKAVTPALPGRTRAGMGPPPRSATTAARRTSRLRL